MSQSKMNVLGYRYHPDTQILSIRYTGGTYRYAAVSQVVYNTWVAASANEAATSERLQDQYKAVYVQPGSSDKNVDP